MKTKKFLLAFITATLLSSSLIGCSSDPDPDPDPGVDPKDQPIQPADHLLPMPSWATPIDELDSYNEDVFYHQNVFSDVKIDFTFDIELHNGTTLSQETLKNFLGVTWDL